jgi:hypothetical protein
MLLSNIWKDAAYSLGAALSALLLGRLVAELSVRILVRWAKHTYTFIDDAAAQHLAKPIRWLLPVIALFAVMPLMTMPDGARAALTHALTVIIIIGVGWAVFKTRRTIYTSPVLSS